MMDINESTDEKDGDYRNTVSLKSQDTGSQIQNEDFRELGLTDINIIKKENKKNSARDV
jgi:hypothetical protein